MRRFGKWLGRALLLGLVLACGSWLWSMPDANERGVWQHEANGNILVLDRLRARMFHQTAVDCAQTLSFPAHLDLVKALEGAWIERSGAQLHLHVDSNIDVYKFNRIDALPEACGTDLPGTPANVFAAMWTIMDEHYPFFDLYGVDWQARRALTPAPEADMSEAELYALLQDTLAGLDDGHVQLIAGPLGYFSPSQPPDWLVGHDLSRDTMNAVARAVIHTELTAIDRTGLEYGLRDDGVGYVLIRSMSTDPGFGQMGSDLASAAFSEVAQALAPARAIIIDVRTNPGGDDGTALAYAGHLTADTRPVLSKRTRQGSGWTPEITADVTPATPRLDQPVVLLTSRLTGSGAEIFTMALRELPQVTVMGENTGGGLSDILGTTLPNGWLFGLSHQEYRTPDGHLYEGGGLPPDIVLEFDGAALARGEDPVLQAAIAQALSPSDR